MTYVGPRPLGDQAAPEACPWLPWADVQSYVGKTWDPEHVPHHSVIGLTGSGKSYLIINGILKLADWDRVLIVDTKHNDPLVSVTGKPITELPRRTWYAPLTRKERPRDNWFRLVVSDERPKAQEQVRNALERVYKEGEWIVFLDETFDLSSPQNPGLGLGPWLSKIWRKGRSRHVSLIAATQAPRWVPSDFYDQAGFAWIGRLRDEDKQKRLLEIGGLSKKELPVISSLKRQEWLLSADNGEYFARTKVA